MLPLSKLKSAFCKIPGASALCLRGADTTKFLQDKTTNDVNKLISPGDSQLTAFLNRKGRFLHSSLLVKGHEENEYILITESSGIPDLSKHIKLFKFRSKVEMEDVSNMYNIWGVLSKDQQLLEQAVEENNSAPANDGVNSLAFLDPRTPTLDHGRKGEDGSAAKSSFPSPMGAIVLTTSSSSCSPCLPDFVEYIDGAAYDAYRMVQGIPRDNHDMFRNESFILESNYDWLSGVSFTKGCYLGQELTARSHHTGVIRKRLMPVYFVPSGPNKQEIAGRDIKNYERWNDDGDLLFPSYFDPNSKLLIPPTTTKLRANDKPAGKILASAFNVGVAQVRFEHTDPDTVFEADGVRVVPLIPSWWPEEALGLS
mmetsp:Transcript_9569/g.13165  ORF Transcript_9569/g.13165 Transcript_9569/m.13165 type:complete len:369 (+) Transcript_9569:87-1193(+)